eukprot:Tbor_TRINITY_DN5910_c1_g2::TRINITY_DN5910_c1_g2_i12::g.18853::m.18853
MIVILMSGSIFSNGLSPGERATIEGVEYSKQQYYIKALEYDMRYSKGWNNLGITLKAGEWATVHGIQYSKEGCKVKEKECRNCLGSQSIDFLMCSKKKDTSFFPT